MDECGAWDERIGEECEMCMCLTRGGVCRGDEGGEWMRG